MWGMDALSPSSSATAIPLEITPAAKDWISSRLENGQALHLGVRGGGCAGLTPVMAVMDLEAARSEGLIVQEEDGIALVVDPEARDTLAGARVDLDSGGLSRRLVVVPAPGREGCGCGLSFRA